MHHSPPHPSPGAPPHKSQIYTKLEKQGETATKTSQQRTTANKIFMFKPGEGEKRADFKKWVGTGGGLEQPVGWGARVWAPEPASHAGLERGEKPARAEKAWQAGLEKKPSWTPGWPSPSVPSGSLPASQALLACQLGGKPSLRMRGQLMGDKSRNVWPSHRISMDAYQSRC